MSLIRIALDAFPYEPTLHRVCDYGGHQIFSKVALPLTRTSNNSVTGLAARCVQSSPDFRIHTFFLRPDLCWSTGDPISASCFVEAFKLICSDRSNRFCNLLADIAGFPEFLAGNWDALRVSAVDSLTFKIRLRNPNRWFPQIVSQLNLSPVHSELDATAGPYQIDESGTRSIRISKNKHWPFVKRPSFEEIEYVNYEEHDDKAACIEDYFSGLIDVTCDTVMPYHSVATYSARADFRLSWPPLGMFMMPGGRFGQLPQSVRKSLNGLIPRAEIVTRLSGVPRPVNGYMDLYVPGTSPLPTFSRAESFGPLTLSYEDFYPNELVAEMVADALSKEGIDCILSKHTYGIWNDNSHVRLEIIALPNFGPQMVYQADVSSRHNFGPDFDAARLYYSAYLQSGSRFSTKIAFELEKIIHGSGLSCGIVAIPSIALCRRNIDMRSVFAVGRRVEKVEMGYN